MTSGKLRGSISGAFADTIPFTAAPRPLPMGTARRSTVSSPCLRSVPPSCDTRDDAWLPLTDGTADGALTSLCVPDVSPTDPTDDTDTARCDDRCDDRDGDGDVESCSDGDGDGLIDAGMRAT